MKLVCPRCREPLGRAKTPEGFVYPCPRCQGRAVALSVVRKLGGRGAASDLWRRLRQAGGDGRLACPVCGRAMLEVRVPAGSGHVRLDVCKACQFVWFDRMELEQLPRAEEPERAPLDLKIREQMALADVETVARRAEASGGDALAGPDEPWKWIPAVLGMPVECNAGVVARPPWLTWSLAVMLLAVYAVTFRDPLEAAMRFGMIPAEIGRHGGLTLVTSFFLHVGLLHLIGNSYFLLVFGDNVEDYLGRWKYAALLLAATVAGDLLHAIADPQHTVPCVGASGGISGVIVFYALAFPRARLGFLFWYWWVWRWFYVPACTALVLWLALQGWIVYWQLAGQSQVSALAHVGGAAVGLAAWAAWRKRRVGM